MPWLRESDRFLEQCFVEGLTALDLFDCNDLEMKSVREFHDRKTSYILRVVDGIGTFDRWVWHFLDGGHGSRAERAEEVEITESSSSETRISRLIYVVVGVHGSTSAQ